MPNVLIVEGRVHPVAEIICKVLDELVALIGDQEHLPYKNLVLCNLEL